MSIEKDISNRTDLDKVIYCVLYKYFNNKLYKDDGLIINKISNIFYLDNDSIDSIYELASDSEKISIIIDGKVYKENKYINEYIREFFGDGISNECDFYEVSSNGNEVFYSFVILLFLYDNIAQIKEKICNNNENIKCAQLFSDALSLIKILNGNIATYLSKKMGGFYNKNVMQTRWIESISAVPRILQSDVFINELGLNTINNLKKIYMQDFIGLAQQCVVNTMICILDSLNIFNNNEKKVIEQMLFPLLEIFRESQIIYIGVNSRKVDTNIPVCDRGRQSNTTRAELVYQYSNGDMYTIRFDTAHKGMEKFHFNISSFGNKNQLFPVKEIENLVIGKECFISHRNDYYYVKEKDLKNVMNTNDDKLKKIFHELQHYSIDIGEEVVMKIMNLFCSLIEPFGYAKDLAEFNTQEIYEKKRFKDIIELYYVSELFAKDKREDIKNKMIEMMESYGTYSDYIKIIGDYDSIDEFADAILSI